MTRRHVFAVTGSVAAIALVLVALSTRPAAQAPQLTAKYFSSYARAHRVILSRGGAVVATLDIPVGVYLSVYSSQPPVRTAQEGRLEFHGNVEIRTRPRNEIDRATESTNAEENMARAPLVLAAQDVDVVSETIIP